MPVSGGRAGSRCPLREVFPETREGRCLFHKTANVLAALPKSAHPGGGKKALAEIWGAEDKDHALAAVKAFEATYGAKFPKAAVKITDDAEELLAFYDYPCEHWVHLRRPIRSNPPSPPSGTGPRSPKVRVARRRAGDGVQAHRGGPGPLARAVSAPHLVALVRAGARFERGALVELDEATAA